MTIISTFFSIGCFKATATEITIIYIHRWKQEIFPLMFVSTQFHYNFTQHNLVVDRPTFICPLQFIDDFGNNVV